MLPGLSLGLLVLSAVLIGMIWPGIVQQFQVNPSEPDREAKSMSELIDEPPVDPPVLLVSLLLLHEAPMRLIGTASARAAPRLRVVARTLLSLAFGLRSFDRARKLGRRGGAEAVTR